MGDPDGKMLPATRSIPPLESLLSSVYPLVSLCPWSVVSVHWEPSHPVWDPQQLQSPGAYEVEHGHHVFCTSVSLSMKWV